MFVAQSGRPLDYAQPLRTSVAVRFRDIRLGHAWPGGRRTSVDLIAGLYRTDDEAFEVAAWIVADAEMATAGAGRGLGKEFVQFGGAP